MLKALATSAALVLAVSIPAQSAQAEVPRVQSASGLQITNQRPLDQRLLELTVTTQRVRGPRKIRVLLPADYDPRGMKRYPVLYLLHGGGNPGNPATAANWTEQGDAAAITAGKDLIVVMPDGGNGGWYTDWRFPRLAAPQQWQSFHVGQLLPFIDQNFRTINRKGGRAIAGLSMGGYGALRYAASYPDKFGFVASFSGALDMLNPQQQRVIFYTELADGKPTDGPFGIGSPLPLLMDGIWRDADPVTTRQFPPARLRGTAVELYVGSGTSRNDPNAQLPSNIEAAVNPSNKRFAQALGAAGVSVKLNDYGRGTNLPGCNGDHNFGCWSAALRDVLPRMMRELEKAE